MIEKPPGEYRVFVKGKSGKSCEQTVTLAAQKIETVRCDVREKNTQATLLLEGLKPGQTVFIDELEVAVANKPQPLTPNEDHLIEVFEGGKLLNQFAIRLEPGQTVRRQAVPEKLAPPPTPQPEPKPEVKPEPKPEVKPEPKPAVKPEPKPVTKPTAKPQTKPQPTKPQPTFKAPSTKKPQPAKPPKKYIGVPMAN
jgi:outer membrane biosynthesis protein TonB